MQFKKQQKSKLRNLMKKAILIIAAVFACLTATIVVGNSANPTEVIPERKYYVSTVGGAYYAVPVSATFMGERLRLYAVTIYFPEKWRLLSVSPGKTAGSYIVTMDMRGVGTDCFATFTLDLAHKSFLEFASEFLSKRYVPSREKKPVILEADFQIYWVPQPSERMAKSK